MPHNEPHIRITTNGPKISSERAASVIQQRRDRLSEEAKLLLALGYRTDELRLVIYLTSGGILSDVQIVPEATTR